MIKLICGHYNERKYRSLTNLYACAWCGKMEYGLEVKHDRAS